MGVAALRSTRICSIVCFVERVGIQELRKNLSAYLAKVKTGSAFTVTHRGKPVAILKPLTKAEDVWQQLIDDGVVVPADGHWSEIEQPAVEVDSNRTTSKYFQEMREDRI